MVRDNMEKDNGFLYSYNSGIHYYTRKLVSMLAKNVLIRQPLSLSPQVAFLQCCQNQ